MKLGLITDVHEHVEHLKSALDCFRQESVDQVVVIGDIFETGRRAVETCELLLESNAVGVWGNHDFGVCVDPDEDARQKYGETAVGFMTSLQGSLEIDGCHFSHVEPWLDPNVLGDLWYFDGPPDSDAKRARIFEAVPNRLMFGGHYHNWLIVTPEAIGDWCGEKPTDLRNGRYFVVIAALCDGYFAIFDTQSSLLTPFSV